MHRGSGLADPSGGPVARKHCVTSCQATTTNLRYSSKSSWEWASGGGGGGFHGNQPYSKSKNEQGVEGERNGEVDTSQEKIKTGDLKGPEIGQNVAHMHPTHGICL